MPELPEVETTRRKLEPLLLGRKIVRLEHQDTRKYHNTHEAHDHNIQQLLRRGKYLMFDLENDQAHASKQLIVHLGMTGGFRLQEGKHSRVQIILDQSTLFFDDIRRFGKIAVVPTGDYQIFPTLQNMGPEPLTADFTLPEFVEKAAKCTRVKPWLLSQVPVAGLGNIYVDESLWEASIHPAQTRLNTEQATRLYHAIRQVLQKAIQAGGSTLSDKTYQQHDGLSGLFQHEHQVYAKEGRPCMRCQTPILKMSLGQRGTHFCPTCQPLEICQTIH